MERDGVQLRRPVGTGSELIGVVVGVLGSLGLAAALVPLRSDIMNANAALVLVLPVLSAGIIGGRWAGAASAVVATLCFDFFFTVPYLSLRISSGNDVETMLVLGAVAFVAAELGIRARASQAQARDAQSELARLRRVADLAAGSADVEDVVLSVCAELAGLLDLDDCRYEPVASSASLPSLSRGGAIQDARLEHAPRGFVLPVGGLSIEVHGRGRRFGRLVLDARPDTSASLEQRVVAVALADELGLALASENDSGEG